MPPGFKCSAGCLGCKTQESGPGGFVCPVSRILCSDKPLYLDLRAGNMGGNAGSFISTFSSFYPPGLETVDSASGIGAGGSVWRPIFT